MKKILIKSDFIGFLWNLCDENYNTNKLHYEYDKSINILSYMCSGSPQCQLYYIIDNNKLKFTFH